MNRFFRRLGRLSLTALLIMTLSGCGDNSADTSNTASNDSAETSTSADTTDVTYSLFDPGYTDSDLDASWSESGATMITLNGSSVGIDGSGASSDGSTLTITSDGVYALSGTLDSGQIIVEAGDSDKPQIVLNGVSVTSDDGPAISIQNADKVFITLADGSSNTLTDSSSYTLADGEDEPNAALYSKEDLTINGSGSLTVEGNYMHGILSKDDLKITGGTITVTAVADGIRGRDAVGIYDGEIDVTAGGDGIKSNNDTDTTRGWVSLDGGHITITAGEDGIQAETALQVTAGEIDIVTGGGSVNAQTKSDEQNFGWGNSQGREDTDSASTKGLKAGAALFVAGGTIDIDSLDDSLHSNGEVTITDGTLNLSSGDDGVHADGQLLIEGGDITIAKSFEGLEGVPVIIRDGDINITASDDGINSAGDDDSVVNGEVAGPYSESSASESTYLEISGGLVVVDAGGDGLDSNGNFYMTGGTVLVTGPTDGANGALDFEGSSEISSGTLIAVGSSAMAMNLGSTSTQPSLMINYSSPQSSGTLLALLDSNGDVIAAFTPEKSYQSVIISTPDMSVSSDYTLYSGGSMDGENVNGLWSGSYIPGTEVVTVNMSDIIVSMTDTGSEITGGMGGNMGDGTPPQDNGTQGVPPNQSQAAATY